MDYLDKLTKQITNSISVAIFVILTGALGFVWALNQYTEFDTLLILLLAFGLFGVVGLLLAHSISQRVIEPVRALWQAILHVSPSPSPTVAPDLEKIHLGKELVTNLVLQIYQLASVAEKTSHQNAQSHNNNLVNSDVILDNIPAPVLCMNSDQVIVKANSAAIQYLQLAAGEVLQKSIHAVLDLAFSDDYTYEAWLKDSRENKATDSHNWSRVRTTTADDKTKQQFDMAAHYNKSSPDGVETIIVLFDKSKDYSKDDDGVGFIALAVHELRTPLTMLRGYIEVFEDELQGKLTPELNDFMQKMHVSAEQLSTFVSNILNVARVEENQLFLELHEENWEQVLKNITADIELRAQVHGKQITYDVQKDLPPVAVDRVSMYEVVSNLIDNAIKYSGKSEKIIVRSRLTDDGMIETTVQDFGIGMPSSIIGNLFEKFYRNHRSRAQVGGTGLGLYLSKAIISAHGGQIWVQSKEGEGSTFGFTIQPYAQLADELKTSDNKSIKRVAHGWIKNHSFYRR